MWTIFNSVGEAVANSDREPEHNDVAARSERAVFHEEVIPLNEIKLAGGGVKRKPLVNVTAAVAGTVANISVTCDDPTVVEIPLMVGETHVVKQPGKWVLTGEPGVCVMVDVDRSLFRGNCLEVSFNA
ncbi:MAG: hypothetical protein H6Q72_1904 [Firmicutes bacterium]|nr:hypothetical protein [Bacillota bacterium]